MAVLSHVPLVSEGVAAALANLAEVRMFAADGDTDGLLRSLRPDAVVVDTEEQADAATAFAQETGAPLLYVSVREQRLHLLGVDGWNGQDDATPEAIRNVIAGALYGRSNA